ncbi:polysaccharide lyase 6 family protein [Hirschia litorea]|uniref:Polysaccharide lyase 6 family protein n=1 Tax=Hirschia litorea TaxID=1199156 RepID=A0ABW2IP32_9PROT
MRVGAICIAVSVMGLSACAFPQQSVPVERVDEAVDSVRRIVVHTQDEFEQAVKTVTAGDMIVLADGVWRDFDAVLEGEGSAEQPIWLTGETPGGVILSGQSSLRLSGKHLIVSGLVFRDGYTPRNEVISFRRDSKSLANSSRVTNTVIENYSNPDRTQRDSWVVMYGKNNEFDHNHLSGKLNSGPTMVVRLNSEESQDNNHHVHHNYFGPRPVLGSNGGETFRIGTSHYSLTNSNTLVEYNYFDRCSGEVEIISNKSGGNTYRNNTFFESRGTLTLRHGNGTSVEKNLFDGNGAPYTGGVRVINGDQTIRNNGFKDLTGERFSGALVVMNGVPNSPINRYHQVDNALIEGNVFENIAAIELGEGSDAERSAVPINSAFKNNVIMNADGQTPFTLHDDMSGIEFSGNKVNSEPPKAISSGFEVLTDLAQKVAVDNYGVAREETGVDWYPKATAKSPFEGGSDINVNAGENALFDAIAKAKAGDHLWLDAGDYNEAKIIELRVPVTIGAKPGAEGKVNVSFERRNLFVLSGQGGLKLDGLNVVGSKAPDNVGNSLITTSAIGGGSNHLLQISNSTFTDFVVNRSFSIVSAAKGTLYHQIKIFNSSFSDVSGSVVKLDAETDDYGMYNVEFLEIENSEFKNVKGPAVDVYRGGRDESTFGPAIVIKSSGFDGVGDEKEPAINLHGVQVLKLEDNTIAGGKQALFTITTGKPQPHLSGNAWIGHEGDTILKIEDLRK